MSRRRRRERPESFSFDSFLDVVANVCGIIIKLILVAWAGARMYQGPTVSKPFVPEEVPVTVAMAAEDKPDPLEGERAREVDAVARLEAQLARLLAEEEAGRAAAMQAADAKHKDEDRLSFLSEELVSLERMPGPTVPMPDAELKARLAEVEKRIAALRAAPSPKKVHRYPTPVSQTVQSEEILFEIRDNRVTAIDLGTMVEEIQKTMKTAGDDLRNRWSLERRTGPSGSFRLKYTIERERPLGVLGQAEVPDDRGSFRYGLTGWVVEPVDPARGETVEKALAPGSTFRQVVDHIDPQVTAITLCVYPDSFEAYRKIRDHLHGREVVVAGRPLPSDVPIAMSTKKGTVSRGQ